MIMQKIREFMNGRYGTDQLSLALVAAGFVSYIIYVFTWFRPLYLISLVFYIWAIFRTLSKNTSKRRAENYKFMSLWYKVKTFWTKIKANFEERKIYRRFKCPACGQKIRIPKGRGTVEVRCPKCSHKFIKKV